MIAIQRERILANVFVDYEQFSRKWALFYQKLLQEFFASPQQWKFQTKKNLLQFKVMKYEAHKNALEMENVNFSGLQFNEDVVSKFCVVDKEDRDLKMDYFSFEKCLLQTMRSQPVFPKDITKFYRKIDKMKEG